MGRKKGSSKKLECLDCMHCKTRVFENVPDLMSWCGRRSIKPNATWVKEIIDLLRVRLLWCEKQTVQYTIQGFSPRNASPRHTADIEKILREERDTIFISNQNRNSFIPLENMGDECPFKSI